MPKRRHLAFLPIRTDSLGTHRIQITLLQIHADPISNRLALQEPLVFEGNLDAEPQTDRDIPLSIATHLRQQEEEKRRAEQEGKVGKTVREFAM